MRGRGGKIDLTCERESRGEALCVVGRTLEKSTITPRTADTAAPAIRRSRETQTVGFILCPGHVVHGVKGNQSGSVSEHTLTVSAPVSAPHADAPAFLPCVCS